VTAGSEAASGDDVAPTTPERTGLRHRLWALSGEPSIILPAILLLAFVARGVWIDEPPGGLIFDEAYYVNASRVILGWPVEEGANYAEAPPGLDPNIEHPPLGKLAIAGSMLVFGDTGLGWRLPSMIAGLVALVALYLIVRATGETVRFAALAVGLLAFDNLTLVHGRIATLDMLALAPVLVGAWFAMRRWWIAAGFALALGFLVKLTAVYAVGAVVAFLAVQAWASWPGNRTRLRPTLTGTARMLLSFLVVGLGGLWLLDLGWTDFGSPIDHVTHMIRYGASLTEPLDHSGVCASATSAPWQWPFNDCEITYLRVDNTVTEGGNPVARYATIDFRGALNPMLAGAAPLAFLYAAWRTWRPADVTSRWSVLWALAHWLPFVFLALVAARVTYLYYFLPVVPALAVIVATLLLRAGLPRMVLWGFVAAYALGFAAYFPFRQIP
jgi:dolichyl-phosphate-mannose-protein mannosyltransferase